LRQLPIIFCPLEGPQAFLGHFYNYGEFDMIYHFTDIVHLGWIAKDGALKPTLINHYRDARRGQKDFIWATTNEHSDYTATAFCSLACRKNNIDLVRFEFDDSEFGPVILPDDWKDELGGMVKVAKEKGVDPSTWRIRRDPLDISKAISIKSKKRNDSYWRPCMVEEVRLRGTVLDATINGKVFTTTRRLTNEGMGYGLLNWCYKAEMESAA
jgi:hypothetical protein